MLLFGISVAARPVLIPQREYYNEVREDLHYNWEFRVYRCYLFRALTSLLRHYLEPLRPHSTMMSSSRAFHSWLPGPGFLSFYLSLSLSLSLSFSLYIYIYIHICVYIYIFTSGAAIRPCTAWNIPQIGSRYSLEVAGCRLPLMTEILYDLMYRHLKNTGVA